MQSNRSIILDHLKNNFKDIELKKHCIQDAKNKINNKLLTRIFDEFPNLLTDKIANQFILRYKHLLIVIPEVNNLPTTLTNKQMNMIHKYCIDIAKLGQNQLLNNSGEIRKDLCELLEWTSSNCIDPCDLICAFTACVQGQIASSLADFIYAHPSANAAISNLLTHTYKNWIKKLLSPSLFDDTLTWSSNHPFAVTALTIGAFGLFATTIALAIQSNNDRAKIKISDGRLPS